MPAVPSGIVNFTWDSISCQSIVCCPTRLVINDGAPASNTSAAGKGYFYPFLVPERQTFRRGWVYNGSSPSNNWDIGIYDLAGNWQASTGAIAGSGASAVQDAAFTAAVELYPGLYYMGISWSSGAVNKMQSYAASVVYRAFGCFQAASVHPLPTTSVTFAAWTAMEQWPYFGVAASAVDN